jgi:hypothetical protein
MRRTALLVSLLGAATASAAPLRVAIAPLREAELGAAEAGRIEQALAAAVQSLPSVTLVNVTASGRLSGGHPSLAEVRPTTRAQALGRELGAARVLVADVAHLGEGEVLYLQSVDVVGGRSLGSTTVSLSSARAPALSPVEREAVRAAVVRVLAPERNVGRLALRIDVEGAQTHVDGHPLVPATGPAVLPVGTHALRVTHPAYRDFLRFVQIELDRTLTLDVALAAYPRAEGLMAERTRAPAASSAPPRWRWWVVGAACAVLAGVTGAIVWAARPEISADRTLSYRALPQP